MRTRVECIGVAVHKVGHQNRRTSARGGRDLLERVGAKGQAGRKDLCSPSNIGYLNGKLQSQVALVIRVRQSDSQRSQDIFGHLDVECRFRSQSSEIEWCGGQLLGWAAGQGKRENADGHVPRASRGIPQIDTRVERIGVAVHEVGQ